MTTSVGRKPLLCRTNVHHSWELAHTADGQRYVRCGKCLKERNSGPGGNVTGPGAMSAGSTSGVSGDGSDSAAKPTSATRKGLLPVR